MAENWNEIVKVVIAFATAKTIDESRRIVEERQDVLLTDAADEVLAHLLTQFRHDEDAIRILKGGWELLARCRQQGVDAAFADYSQPPAATKRDQVIEAVLAFVNAKTIDESRRIVEERRDVLLTDAAEEIMSRLLTQHRDDENTARFLEERRALLARCRREGIDAAFANYLRPSAAAPENALESLLQEVSSLTAPGEMPRRIAVCREALALIERNEQPELWAMLQIDLGSSLQQNPQGVRADNIEKSISHYEQGLKILTGEDSPVEWAQTQNSLALAYQERIREDRAENLEWAISHHEQALEVYTREDFPVDWAGTQGNLALAYLKRIRGERAENIEWAISYFEQALEVFTREDFPAEWEQTQNNLANAYSELLREAVDAFVNAQTWDERRRIVEERRNVLLTDTADEVLTDLLTQFRGSEDAIRILEGFRDLLARCRQQGIDSAFASYLQPPTTANRDEITEAVLALVKAETWEESKRIVEERRDVLLTKAADEALAALLKQYKDNEGVLRLLIDEHRLLLARCRREGVDAAFADMLGPPMSGEAESRANVLLEEVLHVTEPREMPRKIAVCQEALALVDRNKRPRLWAMLQGLLGDSLRKNPQADGAENLEKAIYHFEQALEVFTKEVYRIDWADTQSDLAYAYSERIRGDKAENLEKAIYHFEQALEVRTRKDYPEHWAHAQNGLVNAYRERIWEDKEQNWEEITASVISLVNARSWDERKRIVEERRGVLLTEAADRALAGLLAAHMNDEKATRALEEHRLLLDRCRKHGIDAAFASHLRPPAATPENDLQSLLQELPSLHSPGEMPRRTAVCREALALVDRNYQPELWAMLQVQLGGSLQGNPQGERDKDLEGAISCYEQALEVLTREDFPVEWATTQDSLAAAYVERIRGVRAENIEEAISRYKLALEVRTKENFPRYWAMTQNGLALAYGERIRGVRAENLEWAISHYVQALEVYTRQDFPVQWAEIQNNLALAYSNRILGDGAENIEEAVSRCKLALEVRTREDFPVEWAKTQHILATAYGKRIRGNKAENLEEAISCYERSLEIQTWREFPVDWARIQHNLGTAYQNRIRGKKAENVEEGISRFKLALEVRTREDYPVQWATTQNDLAVAYRIRILGHRAENIEEAISRCKLALEVRTREDFPVDWAKTQHNLANAYGDRTRDDRAENLEEAIRRYEQALEIYTRRDFPVEWAMTQHGLAGAYDDRIRGSEAENKEKAISLFEQALKIHTREASPVDWAATQHDLADAYYGRILGDRADNIEEAISRYELALEVYTREDFPIDWARTQEALAPTYLHRIRGDREQNVEEAIRYSELALEVLTRQDSPILWASAHNDLGNSYSKRTRGDREQNVEVAISHFELDLEVHTRQDSPAEWATTQSNLANAYCDRIRGDREQNVEVAIRRFGLALEVHTRQSFPAEWARTQYNLGLAHYRDRIRGTRAENLELAISFFEQTLEVCTREDFPIDWARAQHYLAEAYSVLIRADREQNVEEAIRRFGLALEVRTPKTLPQDCRDTAYWLGGLLYFGGRFAEARAALTTAHEAVEALRSELVRDSAKQRLGETNADLYALLVHCCLKEDDEEAAFEYAVAGKGRAFVDMLATSRFDLSAAGADDPRLAEDLRRYWELRRRIDDLLARLVGEGDASREEDGKERGTDRGQMLAELAHLRDQEATHWEGMSFRYPAFMATQQAPTFSVGAAQRLSEELGATLVEYYQHAGGWCAFVVSPDEISYVSLPGIDNDLVDIMRTWPQLIESRYRFNEVSYDLLRNLHEAVIAPLGDHLPRGGAVVLAPFSGLHLLPLNAAIDPETGCYAADDYLLGFTPNLATLRVARDQESRQDDPSGEKVYQKLLSVAYPGALGSEHYLKYVLAEAEAVARHFPEAGITSLHEEAATPAAVLSHARGQDVVHFGCHGDFNLEYPNQSGLMLFSGWLTVGHIITEMHLEETKLATIGACLSGRVGLRQGEEHVGLVQAMMSAGAGAVVASLWTVDDAATKALFEAFYAGIEAGKSPAAALDEAARRVRKRHSYEHPYYWAAFQVSGLAHGGDEPDTVPLPDEVAARTEEVPQGGIESVRGGFEVNAEQIVDDSLLLLRQLKLSSGKMREVLEEAGEREYVAERLRALEERVAGVQTGEELVALAEEVHRLVEGTPTLARRLLPKDMDVEAERKARTLYSEDAEPPVEELDVQKYKPQILNEVHEIHWRVKEPPQEKGSDDLR